MLLLLLLELTWCPGAFPMLLRRCLDVAFFSF
jgi:hypothetical protein